MSIVPKRLVAMAFVESVSRSVETYARIGLRVAWTHISEGASEPVWAILKSGGAELQAAGLEAGSLDYPFTVPMANSA